MEQETFPIRSHFKCKRRKEQRFQIWMCSWRLIIYNNLLRCFCDDFSCIFVLVYKFAGRYIYRYDRRWDDGSRTDVVMCCIECGCSGSTIEFEITSHYLRAIPIVQRISGITRNLTFDLINIYREVVDGLFNYFFRSKEMDKLAVYKPLNFEKETAPMSSSLVNIINNAALVQMTTSCNCRKCDKGD